jgi:hypothetical protein
MMATRAFIVAYRWSGGGAEIVRTVQTAVTAKSPAATINSPERKRRSRSMTSRISSFGGTERKWRPEGNRLQWRWRSGLDTTPDE